MGKPSQHPGGLTGKVPAPAGTLTTQPTRGSAAVTYLLTKAMAAFIFLCEKQPREKES